MKKAALTVPSFEQAIAELETLIRSMESGQTPLEELIQKYEHGSALVKICEKHLHAAELKVEQLKIGESDPSPYAS